LASKFIIQHFDITPRQDTSVQERNHHVLLRWSSHLCSLLKQAQVKITYCISYSQRSINWT